MRENALLEIGQCPFGALPGLRGIFESHLIRKLRREKPTDIARPGVLVSQARAVGDDRLLFPGLEILENGSRQVDH